MWHNAPLTNLLGGSVVYSMFISHCCRLLLRSCILLQLKSQCVLLPAGSQWEGSCCLSGTHALITSCLCLHSLTEIITEWVNNIKVLSSWGIIAKNCTLHFISGKIYIDVAFWIFIHCQDGITAKVQSEARLARIKTRYTGFPENNFTNEEEIRYWPMFCIRSYFFVSVELVLLGGGDQTYLKMDNILSLWGTEMLELQITYLFPFCHH